MPSKEDLRSCNSGNKVRWHPLIFEIRQKCRPFRPTPFTFLADAWQQLSRERTGKEEKDTYRSGKDGMALKRPPHSVAELVIKVPQVAESKRTKYLMCKEGRILTLLIKEKRGGLWAQTHDQFLLGFFGKRSAQQQQWNKVTLLKTWSCQIRKQKSWKYFLQEDFFPPLFSY